MLPLIFSVKKIIVPQCMGLWTIGSQWAPVLEKMAKSSIVFQNFYCFYYIA